MVFVLVPTRNSEGEGGDWKMSNKAANEIKQFIFGHVNLCSSVKNSFWKGNWSEEHMLKD